MIHTMPLKCIMAFDVHNVLALAVLVVRTTMRATMLSLLLVSNKCICRSGIDMPN